MHFLLEYDSFWPYVIPPMWCFYSTPHRRFTQNLGWSLPEKTVPAAQHDLHNGLIVRDVVRHADDAQVVGADLMHADLGRFTAFHEVTRLQIHTGLAQVPQPLRECLGTAHAFADDIRARPWVSFLISAMRSSSEVPRTLMTTSAPKYKKPPQAACACGDWRRRRDLNPRAGFIQPTPLAGEPLRPLGYFCK